MLVVVPMVLLVFGAVELVAGLLTVLADPSAQSAAELNVPAFLLPVTIAVVLSTVQSTRWSRMLVAAGAAVALVARVGLGVASFALTGAGDLSASASLLSTAGLGTGLAVTAVAVRALFVHRDLAEEPATPAHGGVVPTPTPAHPNRPGAQPRPASPTTPVNPGGPSRPPRESRWSTATTPWPRADESDPDGTLIRPPHR